MGKYFKRFENHSQYEQYIQSENYIKPNISICNNGQEVHYNSLFVHDYIDLGLPSGTLWATENIKDANGNDLYFAWGEAQGYTASQVGVDKNFSWADYGLANGSSSSINKYNSTDGKTILESEDDAAATLWGENWCMPTKEQFEELTANTTNTWITDGKIGITFTSTINGNSVFFPALGAVDNSNMVGVSEFGMYWSRSLSTSGAYAGCDLYFFSGGVHIFNYNNRYEGRSVRPVKNLPNQ